MGDIITLSWVNTAAGELVVGDNTNNGSEKILLKLGYVCTQKRIVILLQDFMRQEWMNGGYYHIIVGEYCCW